MDVGALGTGKGKGKDKGKQEESRTLKAKTTKEKAKARTKVKEKATTTSHQAKETGTATIAKPLLTTQTTVGTRALQGMYEELRNDSQIKDRKLHSQDKVQATRRLQEQSSTQLSENHGTKNKHGTTTIRMITNTLLRWA